MVKQPVQVDTGAPSPLLMVTLTGPGVPPAPIEMLTSNWVADTCVLEFTVMAGSEKLATAVGWMAVPVREMTWLAAPRPREAGLAAVTPGTSLTAKQLAQPPRPESGLRMDTPRVPT